MDVEMKRDDENFNPERAESINESLLAIYNLIGYFHDRNEE
jgi:hypothetical protein